MTPAASASGAPVASRYFVNAWVDHALIGGGSILAFLLLRAFTDGTRSAEVLTLAALLSWVINWPHFSATSYRLYQRRGNRAQYPLTSTLVPVLIGGGLLLALAYPLDVAPYFAKIFLIWSPYHFSGQTVGLSLLYARRSGLVFTSWERRALWGMVLGTFLSASARGEVGHGQTDFWTIQTTALGVPEWLGRSMSLVMWLGTAGFLLLMAMRSVRERRIVPTIVLVPALAQFVWFYQAAGWLSFVEFVPMFHSLQYLFVAWAMQLKERSELERVVPTRRFITTESTRWLAINIAGGACLFYALPRLVHALVPLPGPHPLLFASGIVLAGVQLHHFFVDGVIWKLKRSSVSSPLMTSLPELLRMQRPDAAVKTP